MTNPIIIDGSLSEWDATAQLDTSLNSDPNFDIFGTRQGETFFFGIASTGGTAIGAGTTIWLDTDVDRTTGYQIFASPNGSEYRIEIEDAGGTLVAVLYQVAAGDAVGTEVGTLNFAFGDASRTTVEFELPRALIGSPDQLRVFTDVNDAAFLPSSFSANNFIVSDAPTFGDITIDGSTADWTADQRLDTPLTGATGYAIYGSLEGEVFTFAIESSALQIGQNTTIWLDTDLNRNTGQEIFGPGIAGSEFNINIDADGVAKLFTGPAGDTFVADLDFRISADGSVFEVAVDRSLIGSPDFVRVFSDVNDTAGTFLPNDYATQNLIAGTTPASAINDTVKVAIVYSATTAEFFFDKTAYGQLFMSAQNQAIQAGIPFDILSEADLTNPELLGSYDAIVFPLMSHVPADQVDAITTSLTIAQKYFGTGLIVGGDFLTNDENGAVLSGDAYARQKALLGTTFEGFGTTTDGITLVAEDGTNPILDGYAPGTVVGTYNNVSYIFYDDITGSGEVLFSQNVIDASTGAQTVDAVIATTTEGRNVHFASDAIIGNNNILGEAIDWVVRGEDIDLRLSMTRDTSLFYSRTDMDQSQEVFDVITTQPNIYDALLPIIEDWYEQYGFVGSYYINIGLYPGSPNFQETDWSVSGPIYQQILALESEIGTHSWTHPDDTNLLVRDGVNPTLDALVEGVRLYLTDPTNPGAIDPFALSVADRNLLATSYTFQFELSKLKIELELGIDIAGAALPGAPEKLDAAREIIQFFDYISGGWSGLGGGFPNAFGYLTPDDTNAVYLAPNMSFDFSLIGFQNLTPAEAELAWAAEYANIVNFGTTPIIVFPWHDYGPTNWDLGDDPRKEYTLEMFTNVIARAAADGAEFVTGADLAARIAAFEQSELSVSQVGNVVTATVTSPDAGKFALTLNDGDQIAQVANWYAWDGNKVFLPQAGGTFEITLGAEVDVTRLADLPMRAELLSVSGNGTALDFSFIGRGNAVVDLQAWGANAVIVSGADGGKLSGDRLTIALNTVATHTVGIVYSGANEIVGSALTDIIIGGTDSEFIRGAAGNDVIYGGAQVDTLWGDLGADTLYGQNGNDILHGNGGNDLIFGGNDNDQLFGGLGFDRIFGGLGDDVIDGGDGPDRLFGEGGVDTLTGGSGNDVLRGGALNDLLDGGDGDDILWGDLGADTLTGGIGNDILRGNGGGDFLDGGEGNDLLEGGLGADTLMGGLGDDTLDGGNGPDWLTGGQGSDTLTGGQGLDVFNFESDLDGADLITDFEIGSDHIRFVGITGVAGFADLAISAQASDSLVVAGSVSVVVAGIDAALLTEDNFIFV